MADGTRAEQARRAQQAVLAQLRARALGVAGLPNAEPVPSPCVSVCRIDAASGRCEGCLRTLDEIARWGAASPEAQRRLWQTIALRVDAAVPSDDAGAPSSGPDAER